jgi:hypothetical protein
LSILNARSSQLESRKCTQIVETTKPDPALVPVRVVKKRAPAAAKIYPPHEHFGSPLNVCRVCGEKYTYVQKPYSLDGLSNSKK